MSSKPTYNWLVIGLLLIFLGALGTRILYLGRADLWQDEMLLVQTADPRMTPGQVWSAYKNIAVSMAWLPMPAMLHNSYLRLADSLTGKEVQASFWHRLPGALLGGLAVPVMAILGFLLGGRRLGWATGIWSLGHFYFIYYSRELHAYPMLMLFAALHWLFLTFFWGENAKRYSWYILFALVEVLFALTHLTAAMAIGASGIVTLMFFAKALLGNERSSRRHFLLVGAAQGCGLLAVAPFFISILTKDNPHLEMESAFSLAGMLTDFVAKVTFGDLAVPTLVGYILLASGILYLVAHSANRRSGRWVVLAFVLSFMLIGLAASRTQYLSARYFMVIAPLAGVFAPAGLSMIATVVAKLIRGNRVKEPLFFILLMVGMVIHLTIFLPPYYRLTAKHEDFRSVADWINERLEPGTPYLLESAYVLRFIGGYYPTPDKIGASPYVHGGGPGEMQRLHERQIAFMRQFPEAPFIETAHHNANTPEGVWMWPAENFARREVQINQDLRDLITFGIYPGDVIKELRDTDFRVDIFYNTWEDRLARASEQGEPVVLRFDGWQVGGQQIAPNASEYFRVAPGARSVVKLARVGDEPVTVDLIANVAIIADASLESATFTVSGQNPLSFNLTPGQFAQIPLRGIELHEPETTLEIRHRGGAVRALLVRDIQVQRAK